MILRAYSIFDTKALNYHAPFFMNTNGQAVRAFSDLANDLNTTVGRHPADYILYCVGTFDDATAELTALAPREHVIDAINLVHISQQLPLVAQ